MTWDIWFQFSIWQYSWDPEASGRRTRLFFTYITYTGEQLAVSCGMHYFLIAMPKMYGETILMNIKCEGQSDWSSWPISDEFSTHDIHCTNVYFRRGKYVNT